LDLDWQNKNALHPQSFPLTLEKTILAFVVAHEVHNAMVLEKLHSML